MRGLVIRMKSYSSREVITILKDDGWYKVGSDGSHHQFKHAAKPGRVTVKHPHKDIPRKTLKRIEEQSGVRFQ
jgi:predicted RNA binding protein YcfA (HicA-like mRNA interferase family)